MGLIVVIIILGFVAGAFVLRSLRNREVRFIQSMLYEEAAAMRLQASALAVEIARRHRACDALDTDFFALWRLSPPLIYPALLPRMHCIPIDGAHRLGLFHGLLADARVRFDEARSQGSFEPSPYRMLCCLIHATNEVEPWLHACIRQYGLSALDQPNLLHAQALLEELEKQQSESVAIPYAWVDCAR